MKVGQILLVFILGRTSFRFFDFQIPTNLYLLSFHFLSVWKQGQISVKEPRRFPGVAFAIVDWSKFWRVICSNSARGHTQSIHANLYSFIRLGDRGPARVSQKRIRSRNAERRIIISLCAISPVFNWVSKWKLEGEGCKTSTADYFASVNSMQTICNLSSLTIDMDRLSSRCFFLPLPGYNVYSMDETTLEICISAVNVSS